ncbi:hypothetical protein BYZ73_06965 [Rhodovulum viride]|uniref:Heavy-metal resistance protein n=2 Tax=Rhodovulum TaxID=34008 RepID=A0ABX9DIX2_9RHOB|nr:hypothetical protein BYZ73_06965 [Rhodovulum viride]
MSMSDPAASAAPRRRSWLRPALGLSLALNVLLLGLICGALLGHRPGGGPDDPGAMMALGPYGRALDEADRAAIREALRTEAPRFRQERREVRQSFRDLLAALRAEPFDAAQVSSLLDRQERGVQSHVDLVRQLMIDRLATMSQAERAAFADRLEAVLRRGPPRHDHRDRGGPPSDP